MRFCAVESEKYTRRENNKSNPMNPNFNLSNLELDELKALYEKKVAELKEKLFSGVAWNDLQGHRDELSQFSVIIYEKIQAYKSSGQMERTNVSDKIQS